MKKKRAFVDPLVGKFFHSFTDEGMIRWQGQVLAIKGTLYLVQLYEWLMGEPSSQELVPVEQMVGWHFYDSASEMKHAYESQRWREAVPKIFRKEGTWI